MNAATRRLSAIVRSKSRSVIAPNPAALAATIVAAFLLVGVGPAEALPS
jgi:hypothetical protein